MARDTKIEIRLTGQEKAELQRRAGKEKLGPWMRRFCLGADVGGEVVDPAADVSSAAYEVYENELDRLKKENPAVPLSILKRRALGETE